MKVGILGSGDVGRKLADGFLELGHQVKIGTRNPNNDTIRSWISKYNQNASIGTFGETSSYGDLLVIATLWAATADVIRTADPRNFARKVVIDVTNPLDFSKGMPPTLSIGKTDSAGETVQRLLPEAKVVKAFNIVGNPHMLHPDFPGGPPTMFICGNDLEAKKIVTGILAALGWETVDIGSIEGARLLEPLAMLWITCFLQTGTGNHAFKLLKK